MWALLSHADMHSGMSLPVAPIDGVPPEVSIGTGARASDEFVSRVAVGSKMVAEVELGIAADVALLPVADSVPVTPVGVVVLVTAPAVVVIVPGAAVVTPVVVVMPGPAAPPDVVPKPGSATQPGPVRRDWAGSVGVSRSVGNCCLVTASRNWRQATSSG